jgi:WD40-like Beta Propeller Repeat
MIVPKIGRTGAYGFFDASVSGRLVHRDSPSETGRFYWSDRQGVKQTPVGEQHYLDASPVISPDGRHFAISRFDDRATEVWTHDLVRDVSQKITKDPSLDVAPTRSADGKTIYFSSGRAGTYDLYRVPAGGGGQKRSCWRSRKTSLRRALRLTASSLRSIQGPLVGTRTPAAESSAKF